MRPLFYITSICILCFCSGCVMTDKKSEQDLSNIKIPGTWGAPAKRVPVAQAPDDIDEAIEQYGKLESSGWKSGTNTAITPDNDQGRFYKSLFGKLAHNKQTIIFQLFLGDTIIASDLTLLSNQSIIILKTTYDENYKRFSPATVLRKFQFEKIFNAPQISQIEFYGKMMDWHYRWTNDTREMFHLNWLSKTGKAIKSIREKIK